jgi:hypothetical protein
MGKKAKITEIKRTWQIVDQIYDEWELSTGDVDDIKSAINEAYLKGAMHGRINDDLVNDALATYKKDIVMIDD